MNLHLNNYVIHATFIENDKVFLNGCLMDAMQRTNTNYNFKININITNSNSSSETKKHTQYQMPSTTTYKVWILKIYFRNNAMPWQAKVVEMVMVMVMVSKWNGKMLPRVCVRMANFLLFDCNTCELVEQLNIFCSCALNLNEKKYLNPCVAWRGVGETDARHHITYKNLYMTQIQIHVLFSFRIIVNRFRWHHWSSFFFILFLISSQNGFHFRLFVLFST